MASRFMDDLGDIFLRVAVAINELLVPLRFLDRVEVLALNILDQRQLGRCRFVYLAYDRRNAVQPRPLRRPPPALAGADLEAVAVRSQQDRLEDSALRNRIGALVDRLVAELDARLVRVWPEAADLNLPHAAAG